MKCETLGFSAHPNRQRVFLLLDQQGSRLLLVIYCRMVLIEKYCKKTAFLNYGKNTAHSEIQFSI